MGETLELSRLLVSLGTWGRYCEQERWAPRQSNARVQITTHCWGWRSGSDGCNLQNDRKRKYGVVRMGEGREWQKYGVPWVSMNLFMLAAFREHPQIADPVDKVQKIPPRPGRNSLPGRPQTLSATCDPPLLRVFDPSVNAQKSCERTLPLQAKLASDFSWTPLVRRRCEQA